MPSRGHGGGASNPLGLVSALEMGARGPQPSAPICVAAPGSALSVRTLTGAHRGPRSLGTPPGQLLRGPGVQGRSRRGKRRGPWALPLPLGRPKDNRAPLAHTASAESDHKGVFGEAGGRRLVGSWASSAGGFQARPGMGCRWEGRSPRVEETSKTLGAVSPAPQMETGSGGRGGTQRTRLTQEGCRPLWGREAAGGGGALAGGVTAKRPARRGVWGTSHWGPPV